MKLFRVWCIVLISTAWVVPASAQLPEQTKMPVIASEWWQITGMPDLGQWNSPDQRPVDFAIWQAADNTWHLWSCIRRTAWPGNTRLLYGWEGASLTESDWQPTGIKFTAQPEYGETEGGMQAPHVVRHEGVYVGSHVSGPGPNPMTIEAGTRLGPNDVLAVAR